MSEKWVNRVNRVGGNHGRLTLSVRSTPNSDRKLKGLDPVAKCHSSKSLCDSGEVRLVLSIIPRGEIVGSGGSALS